MTTASPSQSDLARPEYLLSKQIFEVLEDSLALLEEVSIRLLPEAPHRVCETAQEIEEVQTLELGHRAEQDDTYYLQALHLRFKLHALLFGLGIETRHERFGRGSYTVMPDEMRPGDLMGALQIMSSPMVFGEEEPDSEADVDSAEKAQTLETPLF